MKTRLVILAVAFILTSVARISYSDQRSQPTMPRISISEMQYLRTYITQRVFKDGIWWIYVYDGMILVDFYEE